MQNRLMTCVVGLVAGLALAACGDVQQASGTLEVASVPTAQVAIDGTPHGTTPTTIQLDAGRHEIVLSRDRFVSQTEAIEIKGGESATVETVLLGTDPGDPEVIRALAEAFEIEYQPFEGVERHRGSRDKDQPVVLLWPQKDVRLEGLVTFGIEVSLDYMSDGYLVFKKGRKELARRPFTPTNVMTVAVLPTEVREAVKTGSTITWGLYFDDKRKPVTAKFKVVKNTKVERAIEKLERRKYFKRQPPLTQALMRAQVLHNHRLYTESLLAHLAVVQEFPTSVQPYEGIVTALRRMDGDASELWTLASQHVSGKGGHGRPTVPGSGFGAAPGMNPGGIGTRPAMPGAGTPDIPLRLYDPRVETPTAPAVEQPGTTTRPDDTTEPGATPGVGTPGLGTTEQPSADVAELTGRVEALRNDAETATETANAAREQAEMAQGELEQALTNVREALENLQKEEANLEAAEEAYAQDPTAENQAAVEEARRNRDAAMAEKDALDGRIPKMAAQAERMAAEADRAEAEAERMQQMADDAQRHLDNVTGTDPGDTRIPPRTPPEVPGIPTRPGDPSEPAEGPVLDQLRRDLGNAQNSLADAQRELAELEAQAALSPGDPNIQAQLDTLRQQVEQLQGVVNELAEEYADAGGEHAPDMPTDPAQQAQIELLQRTVDATNEVYEAAEIALQEAAEQMSQNPGDPAAIAAHEAAQQAVEAARAARDDAAAALADALEGNR